MLTAVQMTFVIAYYVDAFVGYLLGNSELPDQADDR